MLSSAKSSSLRFHGGVTEELRFARNGSVSADQTRALETLEMDDQQKRQPAEPVASDA
jgi:hypothetical protein